MKPPLARAFALGTLITLAVAQRPALAWNSDSHDKISRESILFMLRSSIPAVRFAGSVLVSAGEGSRASADGSRAWPLSAEAHQVDNYQDVCLRNDADTPFLPELLCDVLGLVNFTAYNHFLLWGRTTSGDSIEDYPTTVYDEDTKAWRFVYEPRWMSQHDNEPGYTLAADDSIVDNPEVTGLEGIAGPWIIRIGSRGLQQWCEDGLEGVLDRAVAGSLHDFARGIPFLGEIIDSLPVVGTALDAADGLLASLAEPAIDKLAGWAAGYCPYIVGSWENSPAMQSLVLNHSEMQRSDVSGVAMVDIRWHPSDNLATFGVNQMRRTRVVRPVDEFMPPDALVGKVCDPRRPGRVSGRGRCDELTGAEALARAQRAARDKYGDIRPFRSGVIPKLGRLVHAMSDAAVPGHVRGRLLHPEHLMIEGASESSINDFYTYADAPEQRSETGAIVPAYTIVEDTAYELHGLIDVVETEQQIREALRDPNFGTRSIEFLTEAAARETSQYAQDVRGDGKFNSADTQSGVISPEVRHDFLSRAVAHNVIGLTRAVQMFYQDNSSRPWSDMIADVTWTERDATLRTRQPAREAGEQPPRLQYPDVMIGRYGRLFADRKHFAMNVDANYQEYQEIAGCYVRSHDSASVTPSFVDPTELAADIVLSPDNIGSPDDSIHVTGAHSNGRMHIEYFRGALQASAGQTVRVPAGTLKNGVAVWCSGPDIWNSNHLVVPDGATDAETVPAVLCDIAEIRPVGAVPCNAHEALSYWPGPDLAAEDPPTSSPPVAGDVRVAPIADLAAELGTSAPALTTALATAGKQPVTVVYPAPVGKASLVFTDAKAMTHNITVGRTGRVTVRRTGRVASLSR